MSTNDVPGANPANYDELAMGAWAEHTDGSLIFVESTEGNRVIYSIFDMSKDPIIEYRDAMPEISFKNTFSWKPDGKNEKWVWHDKTPFPWDRIIKSGFPDGGRMASAGDILTAAERVAQSLKLKGQEFDKDIKHHSDDTRSRVNSILDKINSALDRFLK
jgi:hypothetical protein